MPLTRGSRVVLALALSLPAALPAQSVESLPAVGQRIRVERTDAPRATGTVIPWGGDTLALRNGPSDAVILIPKSTIERYLVATDRDRRRGARRGAAFGGLLGVVMLGAAVVADLNCDECFIPTTVVAVPAALLVTGVGAGVGAIVAPVRWTPNPTRAVTGPTRLQVGLVVRF